MFASILNSKLIPSHVYFDHSIEIPEEYLSFNIDNLTSNDLENIEEFEEDRKPDYKNIDDLLKACTIITKSQKPYGISIKSFMKGFWESCSFFNGHKISLEKTTYKHFQNCQRVSMKQKGDFILNSIDKNKNFYIQIYGAVKSQKIPIVSKEKYSNQELEIQEPNTIQQQKIDKSTTPLFQYEDFSEYPEKKHQLSVKNKSRNGQFNFDPLRKRIDEEDLRLAPRDTETILAPCVINSLISAKYNNQILNNYKFECLTDCIFLTMPNAQYKEAYELELRKINEKKLLELKSFPIMNDCNDATVHEQAKFKIEERVINFRGKLYNYNDPIDYIYLVREGEFDINYDWSIYDKEKQNELQKIRSSQTRDKQLNLHNKTMNEKLVGPSLVYYRNGPGDSIGHYEIAMGLDKRISNAICMSATANVFCLKIGHINDIIRRNINELGDKRNLHINQTIETNKSIRLNTLSLVNETGELDDVDKNLSNMKNGCVKLLVSVKKQSSTLKEDREENLLEKKGLSEYMKDIRKNSGPEKITQHQSPRFDTPQKKEENSDIKSIRSPFKTPHMKKLSYVCQGEYDNLQMPIQLL